MKHILIVDDDVLMGKSLRRLLEHEGHSVSTAVSGSEALAVLHETAADLVITDIFMPGQDGIGAIMDICRDFPKMKIIAMSGGGRLKNIDYLELARNVGAHRTFQKPFTNKELLAAIEELLR